MCGADNEDQCCQVLQAIADRHRLKILKLLQDGEMCVSEICAHFEMSQPSVSHHLDVLKRAGVVTSEKRGREVYYRFAGETIVDCCGAQFKVLKILLERQEE